MNIKISTLLFAVISIPSLAQGAVDEIEFNFESAAMFPVPTGEMKIIESGVYGVEVTREMYMTLTGEDGDTTTITTLVGNHELELDAPEGLATVGDDGVRLVMLLPGSLLIEAIGSPADVTTRGLRRARLKPGSPNVLQGARAQRVPSTVLQSAQARPKQTSYAVLQRMRAAQLRQQRRRVNVQGRPQLQRVRRTNSNVKMAVQRPDLVGTFDGKHTVTIKNIGRGDAVFPNGGRLTNLGANNALDIPMGGVMKAGGQVSRRYVFSSNFNCPDSPSAQQVEYKPVTIDPANVLTEVNEKNNEVRVTKPFNIRLTETEAAAWQRNPSDVSVRVETREIVRGSARHIEITGIWKNVGANYVYSCTNAGVILSIEAVHEISGEKIPMSYTMWDFVKLAPGREGRKKQDFEYARDTGFGPEHIMEPGCYSISVTYDTRQTVRETNKNNNTATKRLPLNGGSCS